jgi:hypothetical protein
MLSYGTVYSGLKVEDDLKVTLLETYLGLLLAVLVPQKKPLYPPLMKHTMGLFKSEPCVAICLIQIQTIGK